MNDKVTRTTNAILEGANIRDALSEADQFATTWDAVEKAVNDALQAEAVVASAKYTPATSEYDTTFELTFKDPEHEPAKLHVYTNVSGDDFPNLVMHDFDTKMHLEGPRGDAQNDLNTLKQVPEDVGAILEEYFYVEE
jgi:hypothetical protein